MIWASHRPLISHHLYPPRSPHLYSSHWRLTLPTVESDQTVSNCKHMVMGYVTVGNGESPSSHSTTSRKEGKEKNSEENGHVLLSLCFLCKFGFLVFVKNCQQKGEFFWNNYIPVFQVGKDDFLFALYLEYLALQSLYQSIIHCTSRRKLSLKTDACTSPQSGFQPPFPTHTLTYKRPQLVISWCTPPLHFALCLLLLQLQTGFASADFVYMTPHAIHMTITRPLINLFWPRLNPGLLL